MLFAQRKRAKSNWEGRSCSLGDSCSHRITKSSPSTQTLVDFRRASRIWRHKRLCVNIILHEHFLMHRRALTWNNILCIMVRQENLHFQKKKPMSGPRRDWRHPTFVQWSIRRVEVHETTDFRLVAEVCGRLLLPRLGGGIFKRKKITSRLTKQAQPIRLIHQNRY